MNNDKMRASLQVARVQILNKQVVIFDINEAFKTFTGDPVFTDKQARQIAQYLTDKNIDFCKIEKVPAAISKTPVIMPTVTKAKATADK